MRSLANKDNLTLVKGDGDYIRLGKGSTLGKSPVDNAPSAKELIRKVSSRSSSHHQDVCKGY